MFKPSITDPLKNRRSLALIAAANGFFIFPMIIIFVNYKLHISDLLCEKLLSYMALSCMAPVLGYLYAAHKEDGKNAKPPA